MNDVAPTAQPAADDAAAHPAGAGTRIFRGNLFRVRDGRAWAFTDEPPPPPSPQVRRPARVAQVLARAHRIEAAIDAGDYADRADAARQLGFTRARITQIMNLLHLAPDIQERVLDLEAIDGAEPMAERALRDVVRHEAWAEQRRAWMHLDRGRPPSAIAGGAGEAGEMGGVGGRAFT